MAPFSDLWDFDVLPSTAWAAPYRADSSGRSFWHNSAHISVNLPSIAGTLLTMYCARTSWLRKYSSVEDMPAQGWHRYSRIDSHLCERSKQEKTLHGKKEFANLADIQYERRRECVVISSLVLRKLKNEIRWQFPATYANAKRIMSDVNYSYEALACTISIS